MLVRRLLWLVPLVILIAGVLGLRRAEQVEAARSLQDAGFAPYGSGPERPTSDGTSRRPTEPGTAAPPGAEASPTSLSGSEVDGELRADAQGQFVADANTLRFFEYFLSALGELDQAALRARILNEIAARLPSTARQAAGAFLDDYLRYRVEAGDLGHVSDDPEALHAAVDKLYALRREVFGETLAETLFADEEKLRTAALERRLLLADKTLSEAEREQRLAALEQDLPDELRRAREQAALPLTTRDQVAALRARGASDDEVHAARAKALGPEAADRLRQLDLQRADFERRLAEYRVQRAAIANSQRTKPVKDSLTIALFEKTFAPDERARARVLTR